MLDWIIFLLLIEVVQGVLLVVGLKLALDRLDRIWDAVDPDRVVRP